MADSQQMYERIWHAQQTGRIEFGIDLKMLNKPSSPLFSHKDNLLPWVVFVCLVIVGWRLGGWVGALAAGSATLVLIATTINFIVMRRLRERALDHALSGRQGFDELWRFGALSFRLKDDPTVEAQGPGDDWAVFAEARLPAQDVEAIP